MQSQWPVCLITDMGTWFRSHQAWASKLANDRNPAQAGKDFLVCIAGKLREGGLLANPSQVSSVQLLSCVWLFDPMDCSMPGLPVHHQLLELAQTHVHWVDDAIQHLILCHPLLLPSVFPSIRVFSSELILHIRWLNYWSFIFNISPSNEYSGLISFRMGWLDLLAVQGTLKSLLWNHSSKKSVLWLSALFMVQLSHLYMATGKTIALAMPLLTNWCVCFLICCLDLS